MIDCSAAYTPQEFSGIAVVSVLTFDMSEAIDVESVASVMSGGDTVYASTDRLYVANHRWIDSDDEDISGLATHIHRFGIGGPEGPVYEASGSVEGFLLDQFAMSEHDGYLRVASTSAPPWWWSDEEPDSRVDVLERNGRELLVVGSVGGLGRGERIYAVRFMGDIGYVVTFRETDPLYTIDLSDPARPRKSWVNSRSWVTRPTCTRSATGCCSAWARTPMRRAGSWERRSPSSMSPIWPTRSGHIS